MESEGKLLNSCEKVEEKSELKNGSGVGELLQSDQHPDEKKNVSESVEELRVKVQQDAVMMEDGGLEENPHSVLSETAEKSTVELSEQQTSLDPDEKKNVSESVEELKVQQLLQDSVMEDGALEENNHSVLSETAEKSTVELSEQQAVINLSICGTKRKAETLEINNEESQRKWYCSLCEVSTTSEGTLNHHMLGKKHKAKEAKSNKSKGTTTPTTTNMDRDSSHHSLLLQPPVGPTSDNMSSKGEDMAVTNNNKFHCSICQVSTNSEALLKSHLQGKKHKAKEARLGVEPNQNVTMPTMMTQWYCSLCQVSAASEKNFQDHLQGKKHKAKEVEGGQNPLENRQETGSNTAVVETGEKSKNELETKEENKEMMRGEMNKYWHCKMCDVGTHDEALMDAHRKSEKHKEALKENCGGVIVVSTTMA